MHIGHVQVDSSAQLSQKTHLHTCTYYVGMRKCACAYESATRQRRSGCDNTPMSADDDDPEIYPIAYSTAYLCLAALMTIRTNDDDSFDTDAVEYATRVLRLIQAQPETVLNLPPDELERVGPMLLANSRAWLN